MTIHEETTAPPHPQGVRAEAVVFTASWPAVTAWGAGLVLAALGAGAVVGPDSDVLARSLGIALATLGVGFLGWGALSLSLGRLLVPHAVVGAAVAGMLGAVAALLLVPAHTSVLGVGVAILLLAGIAAVAAVTVRRGPARTRTASVWGILLAAAILAAIVTPALGSVQDAVLLRDDGTVPVITHDGH